MVDTVHIMNGSKKLDTRMFLEVFAELYCMRPVSIRMGTGAREFAEDILGEVYEPHRRQVHYSRLLEKIMANPGIEGYWKDGKVFVVDADLYADGADRWCFGGFTKTNVGLGYILLSAARLEDGVLAKQVLRHEVGHMFGAPSRGRKNTVEMLGPHCINDLCTMQQKLSVMDAKSLSYQIQDAGLFPYCDDCARDIIMYSP